MDLNINGARVQVQADGAMPLLWVLRDLLQLTGTKYGCGVAACGACTVRIDGQAVRSCITPVGSVAGRAIQTIEGLGTPDNLSPVQAAFVHNDAQQCGFCTTGFVVACTAMLQSHPNPTAEQERLGLGGNLCRCGT